MVRLAATSWQRFALPGILAAVVAFVPALGSTSAAPLAVTIRSVTVTNVTDSSFTVNWVTDQLLTGGGAIVYGTTSANLSTKVLEPVSSGQRGDVHSITVRSLSPSTAYYFSIADADATEPDSGYVFKVSTGPSLPPIATNRRATGVVEQSDGRTPAAGVLVTVRVLDNRSLNGPSPTTSAPLSTFTDSSGTWSIGLIPRTADNTNFFNYTTDGSDLLMVTVEGGALGVVYPAQNVPIQFDSSGRLVVPTSILGGGAIPAETPVAVEATATPTPSPTMTIQASPTALETPRAAASVTPTLLPASPSATPTRQVVIPTVAPVPTEIVPPPEITFLPSPMPTSAVDRPPAAPIPTTMTLVTPVSALPPASPSVVGTALPFPPAALPRETPARTVAASPTAPAHTPGTSGSASAGGAASPLQSLTLLLATALGLIGLGIALSVAGFVDQRRGG